MNYGVNYGGQKSSVSIHRLPEFPKLGKHFFMGAKRVIGAGFAMPTRRPLGALTSPSAGSADVLVGIWGG
jgi:hypothetical protein